MKTFVTFFQLRFLKPKFLAFSCRCLVNTDRTYYFTCLVLVSITSTTARDDDAMPLNQSAHAASLAYQPIGVKHVTRWRWVSDVVWSGIKPGRSIDMT